MSWEFAAAEDFFPLQPTCHKVIPRKGCKRLNVINPHANKYNYISSWIEGRHWKNLKLRHIVLWQIFFKCFLLFKLEIHLIKQLWQQMLSSQGSGIKFKSQMVDICTWLIYQMGSNVPLDFVFFSLTLPVLRQFVIFLSNIYVVFLLTLLRILQLGGRASPEHMFYWLRGTLFSIPFLPISAVRVSKGALKKGEE